MKRPVLPRLAALMLALLAVAHCSTVRISSDFDPEADFSGLERYAWKPGAQPDTGDPRLDNALLDRRIRGAIDRALAARGFEETDLDDADFLVGYHAAIEGKLDVQTLNDYYGYGYGWSYGMGPGAGWGGAPETHVREYDDGTLIIDISEPRSDKLMWRGAAEGELDERRTPEQRDAEVTESVEKILASFPPKTD